MKRDGIFILDRRGVREIDRLAVEEFAMPGVVLMENAARGVAQLALDMLRAADISDSRPRVAIVCGPGNNGGDGYAAARFLHNAGCDVALHPIAPTRAGSDAAINDEICRRMGLSMTPLEESSLQRADLVLDAVLGTGLDRPVEGEPARTIAIINNAGKRVLAVDLPSGMDCDTGQPLGDCVRATRTATFVGIKKGFQQPDAQKLLGEVAVINIGVPIELIQRLAIARFSQSSPSPRSPTGEFPPLPEGEGRGEGG